MSKRIKSILSISVALVLSAQCFVFAGASDTADTSASTEDTSATDASAADASATDASAADANAAAEATPAGETSAADTTVSTASDTHKIGVLVYDTSDGEVMAFREYLEGYVHSCFEEVDFLYSSNVTSQEEEMAFLQNAIDAGVEGILSFNTFDLQQEVSLCADNQVYYMIASGTVTDENFKSVEDNEYFLGAIGPGADIEYQAGVDMAQYFYDQKLGDSYFILSGGASLGNEMHKQRTMGIIDTLLKDYGQTADKTTEELAVSEEISSVTVGDLTMCIVPGYLDFDIWLTPAMDAYDPSQYAAVLAVLPAHDFVEKVPSGYGSVDCFTEENMILFTQGKMAYLTGKYSSIIGPSFAAMYNAITGYAGEFRDNGKAFRLTQGFWTAEGMDDFVNKYSVASSMELNAYNYEDLESVMKTYNPDTTLQDLENLAQASDFTDAIQRRGLEENS